MEKELVLQTLCFLKDCNPDGDIFGGFLLSQMDIAGAILATKIAKNRVATVALDKMAFVKPVFVGDILKCYATVERVGTTSVTILVEAYTEIEFQERQSKLPKVNLPMFLLMLTEFPKRIGK